MVAVPSLGLDPERAVYPRPIPSGLRYCTFQSTTKIDQDRYQAQFERIGRRRHSAGTLGVGFIRRDLPKP